MIFLKKDKITRYSLRIGAIVCFLISALLLVWSVISRITFLEEKYIEYLLWLEELEYSVASIGNKWLIIVVIMLLYFIHTAFPVYPVSILCVATALVFNTPSALVINIAGESLMFTVKYFMGFNQGDTGVQKIVNKSSIARKIISDDDGHGSPWVLAVCRILPFVSLNMVSQLYGSMKYDYRRYMLISLFAYLPRTLSYITIGRNVYNPFSLKLSIPLLLLSVVSGAVMLSLSKVLDTVKKHNTEEK